MDLVAALLSAVLATLGPNLSEPPAEPLDANGMLPVVRSVPRDAPQGVMQPPRGDGLLTIGDKTLPLAPTVQFRSAQNLIVVPMQIQDPVNVVYLTDAGGAVHRVWMLTPREAASRR